MPTYPYLTQLVHNGARLKPDQACLIYGDRRTTNREFRDRVSRVAGALTGLGVQPGDRVAMIARNSDRLVESFFGCFWAGAIANPINTRWNRSEMAYALNDCGATILLIDDPFLGSLEYLKAEVPTLVSVVHIGEGPAGDPELHDYEEILGAAPPLADVGRSGDDVAFVLYTGGTTGFPKGVMLTHANLMAASTSMLAMGCATGEVYLHAPPLFHIAGVQVMLGHFLGGQGPHVIVPAFTPEVILEAIDKHHVSDVMLVPTMLQMVLSDPSIDEWDLGSLKRVFYGAAPMTEALLRRAMEEIPGSGFVQGYGMTETALTVMLPPWYYTEEGLATDKTGSVGMPVPGAELAIRDEDGHEVNPGTVGEVVVRSASVMLGYYGNQAQTAATIRDGWLYSGDAGYLDEDGFLFLVDRLKDMIITGGENVYSSEVERVLAFHPAIADCAVIGIPHETWGEQVHAVVTLARDAAVSEDELIEYCRQQIAAFKCPRSVEFRDALPISAAGKILKTELRAEHG